MKKASAANSNWQTRLKEQVFFLDRCLGKSVIAGKLRAAGLTVVSHFDEFPQTESVAELDDSRWLKAIGARGWLILTKDQHFDRNQIELAGLLASGAPCLVLTGGNMTGEQMADAFLRAMPAIARMLTKFPRPFVARVTIAGTVQLHLTHAGLIKKIK